jgi:excisionase family DNA binding protein
MTARDRAIVAQLLRRLAQAAPLLPPVFELLASELEARATAPAGAALVPELVTVADYARARSISKSTVRAAIRDGRLPAMKIGRAARVRADAQSGKPAPADLVAQAGANRASRPLP